MRTLLTLLLAAVGGTAVAGSVGPNSSWDEIAGDPFYAAREPAIMFHVVSSNGVGATTILRRPDQVRLVRDDAGKPMLHGGTGQVCEQFSSEGSYSQRRCLATESVELARPLTVQSERCVERSGDACVQWVTETSEYPLSYRVKVVKRASVSDSFSFANPAAFYKTMAVQQ